MAVTKTSCKAASKNKSHDRKFEKPFSLKWNSVRLHRKLPITVWKLSINCRGSPRELDRVRVEYVTSSDVSPTPSNNSLYTMSLLKSDSQITGFQIYDEYTIDLCYQFAVIGNYDDSYDFLLRNPFLVCETTVKYLTQWGASLHIATDLPLIERIGHQATAIKCMVDWKTQLELDEAESIEYFFAAIHRCTMMFREEFCMTIDLLIFDILCMQQKRAIRLGPNGIDPFKVLDMLPYTMRYAFIKHDISILCKALDELEPEEGLKYMRYCIHAGIWVTKYDSGNDFDQQHLPEMEDKLAKHWIPNVEVDISDSPILCKFYYGDDESESELQEILP